MIENYRFEAFLEDLYRKEPCTVLPNAMWKTKDKIHSLQCSDIYVDGEILELKGWDADWLYIFWNKTRKAGQSFQNLIRQSSFMIIHNDYCEQLDTNEFSLVKPYFRIKHDNKNISPYILSNEFYIREAYVEKEYSDISNFIGECYKDLHPSAETVKGWTTHKVFDSNLWIWIMDKCKDIPVALGIAEFDSSISEGSLEWIQVLPEYHGRGLGKALVVELLSRLKGRADFTTVSGEVDNETNPERLYRSCGFTGNDVWWLLRK